MFNSFTTNTIYTSRCLGGSDLMEFQYYRRVTLGILLLFLASCNIAAQDVKIIAQRNSEYSIAIPGSPTVLEQKAANILQKYLQEATGVSLPVIKGTAGNKPAIYLGNTDKGNKYSPEKVPAEGWRVMTHGNDVVIKGGSGKGLMYGVYTFLEKYVGGKKIDKVPAIIAPKNDVTVSAIPLEGRPLLVYREVYYPASLEAEYLEWNKLQQFEDLWGLWGHSYDKLVSAKTYFKAHPEYYALVKGRRQPTQLCLSNENVYRLVVTELKKRIAANPDALYWSVSPNDDNGYCQCDKCSSVDAAEGGPQGSLITFVNKVAANFPDKKITTLAYGYTHKPTKNLKPAGNVVIFLSDIDAYRDKPLATEPTATSFRDDLKGWSALTPNIFVWDYITQFTNYLAPFPNFHTLQPNAKFFAENGVKGVFTQGSGETYSEFAELRCYLSAKLLEDPNANVEQFTTTFLNDYYGPKAGPLVSQYIKKMQDNMLASHRNLDIYGNPVNEWATWLSPEAIDQYSAFFDKAEALTEGTKYEERIMRARLPLEYTVLQQARFYGIEKNGVFVIDNAGKWTVKPKFQDRVSRFVANCKKAGVTELSEGGLTPDLYQMEWAAIFKDGVTNTIAVGAAVTLQHPAVEDYPAKGARTLVDGNPGYRDFSYNWLCFYGTDMVATIDLGKSQPLHNISMHFLDDPRHWIFQPLSVKIEVSQDGTKFKVLGEVPGSIGDEHYEISRKQYSTKVDGQYRYVRITALKQPNVPDWRFRDNKKPMIACDEVYID